ncbi:sugar phosphate isomerase/epimerase family protein [Tessaracoccus lacteus]|uniref:Sugar phosphate isomerase/epimerase family protein n=1 Tax=Tessaracoccus lacteus TaxID=3041766 RepID=A0ABY8PZ00_9ACTN|nr:sugar phosphate isomerase/epimerase family protein [Tessaracoccus sp. T21]WGT47687.1 sugar phosphate isomerase/epimerase family protein [Tessaracoccus sp. T21]
MNVPQVLLSTTSVFPEASTSAFELSASLGYDGVELMVGVDSLSVDIDAIAKLADYHGVPVRSVHAPTLLVTQGTWGNDSWEKLRRSGEAVRQLGGDVVVVHPPFRWQRDYGKTFVDGIATLNADFDDVKFCVENMYPWRTPAGNIQAYLPGWDPTDFAYEHLTLDLSHASTSQRQSMDFVHAWGSRLAHVHLTDGKGSLKDEHLLPGEGDQSAWDVLAEICSRGFEGHIVLEVSTRRARSRAEREALLGESLENIRRTMSAAVPEKG